MFVQLPLRRFLVYTPLVGSPVIRSPKELVTVPTLKGFNLKMHQFLVPLHIEHRLPADIANLPALNCRQVPTPI